LRSCRPTLGAYKDTIVVVMTGNPSVTSSIEALRAGAWDYLPKPFSATHLQVLIGRASHAVMMSREAQDLRVQLMKQHGHSDKIALIGISPLFRQAVDLARRLPLRTRRSSSVEKAAPQGSHRPVHSPEQPPERTNAGPDQLRGSPRSRSSRARCSATGGSLHRGRPR